MAAFVQAELEGHPEKRQQPHRLRWKGLEPAGILQSIIGHSVAVTDYLVHGIKSTGDRCRYCQSLMSCLSTCLIVP